VPNQLNEIVKGKVVLSHGGVVGLELVPSNVQELKKRIPVVKRK
jgi:hypothetical protein